MGPAKNHDPQQQTAKTVKGQSLTNMLDTLAAISPNLQPTTPTHASVWSSEGISSLILLGTRFLHLSSLNVSALLELQTLWNLNPKPPLFEPKTQNLPKPKTLNLPKPARR